jgi:transcriptional regulator with XRE-family HTH domain
MPARNPLLAAPPIPVQKALTTLGANIRTARLRRNLTLEDVAAKIGVGRHAVAAAENGKPSTGIVVYAALLWTLGLVEQLALVADPARDEEGQTLELAKGRVRSRPSTRLDNEF